MWQLQLVWSGGVWSGMNSIWKGIKRRQSSYGSVPVGLNYVWASKPNLIWSKCHAYSYIMDCLSELSVMCEFSLLWLIWQKIFFLANYSIAWCINLADVCSSFISGQDFGRPMNCGGSNLSELHPLHLISGCLAHAIKAEQRWWSPT